MKIIHGSGARAQPQRKEIHVALKWRRETFSPLPSSFFKHSLSQISEQLPLVPDEAPRPDVQRTHGDVLPHALTHPDGSELGGPTHRRHKPD